MVGEKIGRYRILERLGTGLRLGADDPFTRYYAAAIYAQLGRRDDALSCLEKAAESRRALTAVRARVDPLLDPLRPEPRFQSLFQEVP